MSRAAVMLICAGALAFGAPPGAAAFERLSSFATFGKDSAQLGGPGGMAIAEDGTTYIADTANNRIDVFAPNENFIHAFGKGVNPSGGDVCTGATICQQGASDGSAGALNAPANVLVTADGQVYVADTGNNRISVFTADGSFLRAFGKGVNPSGGDTCTAVAGCQKGLKGAGAGFVTPTGIESDSAGTLYVLDEESNRVDVFTADGTFVRAFGRGVGPSNTDVCTPATECKRAKQGAEAGSLESPSGVAIDAKGQQIAVSDTDGNRISIFDVKGQFVRAFGRGVTQDGDENVCTTETKCRRGKNSAEAGAMDSPDGLALSSTGSLYVADTANNRVDEFDFDGTFIQAFGMGVLDGTNTFQTCTKAAGCKKGIAGTAAGAISAPSATAFDCRGALYVIETLTGVGIPSFARVERFGEAGSALPPCTAPEEPVPPLSPPGAPPGPALDRTSPKKQPHAAMKPKIEIELNSGSGTAVLIVTVADPGTLVLKGKEIRTVKKRAKGAGLFELLLQPKGKALQKLEGTGKATVKVSLAFKPEGAPSITQGKSVALKMAALF